jgi:hypothetical protein
MQRRCTDAEFDERAVDMPGDDLLTTKQVCEQYPFNAGTLRFWRSADQGPASFALGRGGRVVYRRSEIERWLTEQEQATRRGGSPEVA